MSADAADRIQGRTMMNKPFVTLTAAIALCVAAATAQAQEGPEALIKQLK
jgi:hypothetical protein